MVCKERTTAVPHRHRVRRGIINFTGQAHVADPFDHVEGLLAHRAGIHPQRPAQRTGDPLQKFQSAQLMLFRQVDDAPHPGPAARQQPHAIHLDLRKFRARQLHHHARDPAIAHQ